MSVSMVNLGSEYYNEFLRCISILKDQCNDSDVRNGIIRQRSNEKISIFEIDLTNLIQNLNIPLTNLKQKIELLKIFENQEVSIEVDDESPQSFSFSDQYSTLKFMSPRLDYIDNKFMSEEELNSLFSLDESDLILSATIPKNISDRIRTVTQNFNVNAIQVSFEGETATLLSRTQSKDQTAKFYSGVLAERPLNSYTNVVTIPFVIDHDGDVYMKMYNIRENIVITKFSTEIGDTNIVIYTRSTLITEENELNEN